jgi:catechol 2,3-dioxygenase-like lactoylglutathione lyase family enzyme
MSTLASAPVMIRTSGLDHVALRSSDLERSRRFYVDVLGFPPVVSREGLLIVKAGDSLIGIVGPDARTPLDDAFSPFRLGLDHVALRCDDEAELHRVAAALTAAGVEHTDVRVSPTRGNKYVAFKDPDRIAWQLCTR